MNNENDKIYSEGIDLETYEKLYNEKAEVLKAAKNIGAKMIRRVKKTQSIYQPFSLGALQRADFLFLNDSRPGILEFCTFELDITDIDNPKKIYLEYMDDQEDVDDLFLEASTLK